MSPREERTGYSLNGEPGAAHIHPSITMHITNLAKPIAAAVLLLAPGLLVSCSNTRQDALENRQSRMDSRTDARAQRWQTRGEREDARAQARFDAM